jgi:hypothetical protein
MKSTILLSLIVAGLSVAGCTKHCASTDSFFRASDEPSAVVRTLDIQAENGARADATLYGVHFDGSELNELGKQKLAVMFASGKPLAAVYVDSPGKMQDLRLQSVREYLKSAEHQLHPSSVIAGPNPDTLHRSAGALKALAKTEGTAPQSAPASTSTSDQDISTSPAAPTPPQL